MHATTTEAQPLTQAEATVTRPQGVTVRQAFKNAGVNMKAWQDKGYKRLHIAAACGLIDVVEYCLEDGDYVDKGKVVPLILAAESGHFDVVKLLVDEYGANIHKVDRTGHNYIGRTALTAAVNQGHVEIVAYLLDKGAKPCSSVKNEFELRRFFREIEFPSDGAKRKKVAEAFSLLLSSVIDVEKIKKMEFFWDCLEEIGRCLYAHISGLLDIIQDTINIEPSTQQSKERFLAICSNLAQALDFCKALHKEILLKVSKQIIQAPNLLIAILESHEARYMFPSTLLTALATTEIKGGATTLAIIFKDNKLEALQGLIQLQWLPKLVGKLHEDSNFPGFIIGELDMKIELHGELDDLTHQQNYEIQLNLFLQDELLERLINASREKQALICDYLTDENKGFLADLILTRKEYSDEQREEILGYILNEDTALGKALQPKPQVGWSYNSVPSLPEYMKKVRTKYDSLVADRVASDKPRDTIEAKDEDARYGARLSIV